MRVEHAAWVRGCSQFSSMSPSKAGLARSSVIESPFSRLAVLLEGIEPGMRPIDLSAGGPRHPMPGFLIEKIAEAGAGFGQYPAIRGTAELRASIAAWLGRRYPRLRGAVDPGRQVLPVCGSREALFFAMFPAVQRRPDIARPAALIPNPFYQTYAAAALAAGAEPVYLPADAGTGFLPDMAGIKKSVLERTAAMFLCSPSNPQGAVAGAGYLRGAVDAARRYDFMLIADECYSEIYIDAPPPGALEAAIAHRGDFANVIAFQSLSKRSNVPGLRSGFCAGDPGFIESLARFRNVAAPQLPLPIQHASAALWGDETHVEQSRALYRAKFDAADEVLAGKFGYARPHGGFFLWLDLGGGEEAVKTLWQRCGVKLLPGAYLARPGPDGRNPGAAHVRVAMVADLAETTEALTRIVACLG